MCAFIQTMTVLSTGEIFVSVMILIVGFSFFVSAFVLDIEKNVQQLNNDLIKSKNRACTVNERIEMTKKLTKIIEFHSQATELSRFTKFFCSSQ